MVDKGDFRFFEYEREDYGEMRNGFVFVEGVRIVAFGLWLQLILFSSFAFQAGRMTKKVDSVLALPRVARFASNLGLNDGTPFGVLKMALRSAVVEENRFPISNLV